MGVRFSLAAADIAPRVREGGGWRCARLQRQTVLLLAGRAAATTRFIDQSTEAIIIISSNTVWIHDNNAAEESLLTSMQTLFFLRFQFAAHLIIHRSSVQQLQECDVWTHCEAGVLLYSAPLVVSVPLLDKESSQPRPRWLDRFKSSSASAPACDPSSSALERADCSHPPALSLVRPLALQASAPLHIFSLAIVHRPQASRAAFAIPFPAAAPASVQRQRLPAAPARRDGRPLRQPWRLHEVVSDVQCKGISGSQKM